MYERVRIYAFLRYAYRHTSKVHVDNRAARLIDYSSDMIDQVSSSRRCWDTSTHSLSLITHQLHFKNWTDMYA